MKQLYTRWGKDVDPENVLKEYPRPLMVRENYMNLNGYWDYAFTEKLYLEAETLRGADSCAVFTGMCALRGGKAVETGGVPVVSSQF